MIFFVLMFLVNAGASDLQWLRLLHRADPTTHVRSKGFYLDPDHPERELEANLKRAQEDKTYACEFPARDRWLRAHFKELKFVSPVKCEALERWREQASGSISVVYPNHSLESTLSVFSHTFLKFNSVKWPKDSYLHKALGFAADFQPDDSLLKMAALGVFGGYAGKFALSDYYTEVKRYGEAESRDIFEYELNLTSDERKLLVDHIWEISEAEFGYYFLKGNCSYFLLSLLEVVKPDLNLTRDFHFVTLPLGTLKLLLKQNNLIGEHRWLPSKKTREALTLQSLSPAARSSYEKWRSDHTVDPVQKSALPQDEQIQVLDLLSETTRVEKKDFREQVLRLRSELPASAKKEFPLPKELPENSHGGHLVSVGGGAEKSFGFAQLRYRFVLHNLIDPPEGYFRNTTLEVGDLRLRYGAEQWNNSSATLVNLLVLNKWSWQARSRINDMFNQVQWQNGGGTGVSVHLGRANIYALAIVDSYLGYNSSAFAGGSFGATFDWHRLRFRGNIDHLWALHSVPTPIPADYWRGEWQLGWTLSANSSVQLNFARGWSEQTSLMELVHYY